MILSSTTDCLFLELKNVNKLNTGPISTKNLSMHDHRKLISSPTAICIFKKCTLCKE